MASIFVQNLAVSPNGTVLFADSIDNVIRKLTPVPTGVDALTTTPLSLSLQACTSTPSTQLPLAINLGGSGSFTWSATISVYSPGGGNWLSLDQTSGSGSTTSINVSANAAGLTAGTYGGSIVITSPQSFTSTPVTVPVTLTVGSSCAAPPTLTSITPASGMAGSVTNVTLTGSGFIAGATTVAIAGTGVSAGTVAVQSGTSLTAVFTATSGATPGLYGVTVSTASGTSGSVNFTVNAAPVLPVIAGISPSSGVAGANVPATVSGSGLTGATAATFSGTGVTAVIGSGGTDTSLPITITIGSGAASGARTFTVTTPASVSAAFNGITVSTPQANAPVLNAPTGNPSGLSQAIAPLYGGNFTLTVNGQNFDSSTHVFFGGTQLATTFVSSIQLTATVTTAQLASPGSISVTAVSSAGTSNALSFMVVARGDLNSNGNVNIGDALVCALTVGGIDKPPLSNSVGDANLNGNTNIGDCLVTALFAGRVNPNFTVPTITSISPSPAVPGSSLTITGTGFAAAPSDQPDIVPDAECRRRPRDADDGQHHQSDCCRTKRCRERVDTRLPP